MANIILGTELQRAMASRAAAKGVSLSEYIRDLGNKDLRTPPNDAQALAALATASGIRGRHLFDEEDD